MVGAVTLVIRPHFRPENPYSARPSDKTDRESGFRLMFRWTRLRELHIALCSVIMKRGIGTLEGVPKFNCLPENRTTVSGANVTSAGPNGSLQS